MSNYVINVEIKTDIPLRSMSDFVDSEEGKFLTKFPTPKQMIEVIKGHEAEWTVRKTHWDLQFRIPVERDEFGHLICPTSLMGKYLDMFLFAIKMPNT